MRSFRAAFLLACIVLVAVPAFADITIKMTMTTTGGPAPMDMSSATWIKGTKMRSDVRIMGQDMSIFVDVAATQQVMVNNVTKEVMDPGAAMADAQMTFGEVKVSVKPTDQTKQVLSRTCAGYTVEMTMPMTIMDETVTMTTSGMVWIAKDAPGVGEYQAFTKAAAAAGLMTAGFARGPQAKGLSQMQVALAENGIPLEQEMQIAMAGSGPVAEMMVQSGAGNMKMTMTVTAISADPIPAETFTVPGSTPKK